jgi:hypothetical protein
MGRYVSVPGFASGVVDERYIDRVDVDVITQSLRVCENWQVGRAGEIEVRPGLKATSDYSDFNGRDFLGLAVYQSDEPQVYAITYNPSLVLPSIEIFQLIAGVWTSIQVLLTGLLPDPPASFDYAQIGGALVVATGVASPIKIEDGVAEYIELYDEGKGFVQTAHRVSIQLTDVGDPNPGIGDIVTLVEGSGLLREESGEILDVESRVGSTVTVILGFLPISNVPYAVGTGTYTIGETSYSGVSSATEEVLYSGSDIRSQTFADDIIRVAGLDVTIDTIDTDNTLTLTLPFTTVFGEHIGPAHYAFRHPGAFEPSAVAGYQNRVVYGNLGENEDGMRVVFSAAYDSSVIAPYGQLQDDPASPIDVIIATGTSDSILWLEGGDTLYVGADRNEYAIVDPAQPVGATQGLLPNFRVTGNHGSEASRAHEIFDGKVFVGVRDEGGLVQGRYDFQQNRYNMEQVGAFSGFEGSVKSLAVRPHKQYDPVQRLLIVTSSQAWLGVSPEKEASLGALTRITLPEGATIEAAVRVGNSLSALLRIDGEYVLTEFNELDPDFSLDLPIDFTGAFLPAVYRSKAVYWTGVANGVRMAGGEATVAANGSVTGVNSIDFDDVIIGFPVVARAVTSKVPAQEDRKGPLQNRRKRIVSAVVSHAAMRQYYINNKLALQEETNLGFAGLPTRTGSSEQWGFGFSYDPSIEITSMVPYRGIIRSINMEVAG